MTRTFALELQTSLNSSHMAALDQRRVSDRTARVSGAQSRRRSSRVRELDVEREKRRFMISYRGEKCVKLLVLTWVGDSIHALWLGGMPSRRTSAACSGLCL